MNHGLRLNEGENPEPILKRVEENQQDDKYFTTHYPRTKDEWWKNVDNWWPELMGIAGRYLDLGKPDFDLQDICDTRPLAAAMEEWKRDQNIVMERLFGKVWCEAPDHGSIHANKGWDVLCDLCSESYVLSDEEEE